MPDVDLQIIEQQVNLHVGNEQIALTVEPPPQVHVSLGGAPGPGGPSAYQLWLNEGNVGTLEDFYAAIGPPQTLRLNIQLVDQALKANEILYAATPPNGETWAFPANFNGSSGRKLPSGVNPASTLTLDVRKNGTSVGSIVIATTGVVTFTTASGAPFSIVGGTDVLEVVGPATVSAAVGYVFLLWAEY
jgi:hypothetical protein